MGGNSPSKDKTHKSDEAPGSNNNSSGRKQQQNSNHGNSSNNSRHLKQQVPAHVPPGLWTKQPTLFVGAPATAYQYQKQNGAAPKPGYANGQPIGRHFTSEPALNQNPVRRPAPLPLGRVPPPAPRGARGQPPPGRVQPPPARAMVPPKKAKPPPVKVGKLAPPPPKPAETQGQNITLDPETIKLRNSQLVSGFATHKSATARVFVQSYYPTTGDPIGQTSNGTTAHAYSSGQDISGAGGANVRRSASAAVDARDKNNYVQSDWDVNYTKSGYFMSNKDGGYTKVSGDVISGRSGSGGATSNPGDGGGFDRQKYHHGVFIAQPLGHPGTMPVNSNNTNDSDGNKRRSDDFDNERHYEDLDAIRAHRNSTAVAMGGGGNGVKRSVSDVSHLRRSGAPNEEDIYARPDKLTKKPSARNSAVLPPEGVVPESPSSPPPPPVPPPPPISPSPPTAPPSHHQATLDAVRDRREEMRRSRRSKAPGTSAASETGEYTDEGDDDVSKIFDFLDDLDDGGT